MQPCGISPEEEGDVFAPDLGRRLAENPLLTNQDVVPSLPQLEVVSVFNAAAARVDGETLLLLRVAERPRHLQGTPPPGTLTIDLGSPDHGLQLLPPDVAAENLVGVAFLDATRMPPAVVVAYVRRDQPGVDLADPRTVRIRMDIRKSGEPEETREYLSQISHLRLARSKNGAHFQVDAAPALVPSNAFEEYGCEDPRATLIDGVWHITYVSVGRIGITTSRVTTTDFKSFQRQGVMFLPDHKDVALFPARFGRRYAALTRPMPQSFDRILGIWISFSDELVHWGGHQPLALPRKGMWDALRTGASAVPFRVTEGWLELYHGVDVDGRYSIGALLLDGDHPDRVIARSPQPILTPSTDYERTGLYSETVFSCGHVPLDDQGEKIRLYYGAADSCLAAADFEVKEIIASLARC
jgi:predicted GH43/DUF377 family glycosyl hydrolase